MKPNHKNPALAAVVAVVVSVVVAVVAIAADAVASNNAPTSCRLRKGRFKLKRPFTSYPIPRTPHSMCVANDTPYCHDPY